ncbi:MAG: YrbL family protein [Sulfurovaceae bacterium]|nr:YrbL family protein [Sulfurovaceae bacterium]
MANQKDFLTLSEDLLLGEGMGRKCYIYPGDNDLCIKIPLKRAKRSAQREINYLRRLHKRGKSFDMIADYKGDIVTNIGRGNLYELVRDYDSSISKNLEYYLNLNDKKITSKILNLIEDLRSYLIKEYILFSDLDMDNILVKKENEFDYKLVVIDGIGDNNQIQFLEYFPMLGMKRCVKKWDLFKTKIGQKFPNVTKNIKSFSD